MSHPPLPRATANPDKPIRKARMITYPKYFWLCLAAFFAILALFQLASWINYNLYRRRRSNKTAQPSSSEGGGTLARPRRFAWRNVPTALVNSYRVFAFRWTINVGQWYKLNLAEVFVTCLYIVALFTWEFINTTDVEGIRFDSGYYAHRGGVLAASQLPLITALGTKNNIISYITGIGYDKLNYAHRMTSRVVFILFWVHGGGEMMRFEPSDWHEWYVHLGISMMITFTALIIVSVRPVRAHRYEAFNIVHFLVCLIVLIGGYFHAHNFGYDYWVWPSLIIWGIDRVVRLLRIIYYNHLYFSFPFSRQTNATALDASLELLSPHLVRLRLQRPPHFHWTPGQTAYLTMPGVSNFPLEAHPFTIASVDAPYQLRDTDAAGTTDAAAQHWKELVFLINVRAGFTRRLAARAARGERVRTLVDGPYGFAPEFEADDAAVLVAGGSGVSFTLSALLGLLGRVRAGTSRCRRVVFVWAIRDGGHVEWVADALCAALERAPSEIEVVVRVYVTGGGEEHGQESKAWKEDDSVHSSDGSTASASAEKGAEKEKSKPVGSADALLRFPAVRIVHGARPDLAALLREEVETNVGRLAVAVCGSQGIAQECRKALRVPMSTALRGGPSVVLHVESFGYA